jgi:hypothetical protein
MPGLPGTVPGVPGTPGGQTPDTQSGTEGSSGQPDGQTDGQTEGTGSGGQPTWETAPEDGGASGQPGESGGQPGQSGESSPPGGSPGEPGTGPQGSGGSGTSGENADEESWESGLPEGPGGNGGWATSNEIPGVNNNMPPMPSERDLPPGSGGDSELDKALQDFDGEILAEREVIQARSNESAANSGAPGALPGSGSSSGGISGGKPAGGNASSDNSTPFPGNQGPRSRSAPPAPTTQANVPADLPDARDDDIIARQLREAAMNETDPELQEKLWEEYRRYKDG